MKLITKHPFIVAMFGVMAAASVVSGCTSTASVPTPATASSTPTSTASTTPAKSSASCIAGAAPASTTVVVASGTVTTPTAGGCSMAITLNVTAGAGSNVTITTQLTAPAGLATPGPAISPPAGFTGQGTPVFYVLVKPATGLTVATSPAVVATVNSLTAGTVTNNFYVSSTSLVNGFQGYGNTAGTLSGSTISFPAGGAGSGGGVPAGDTLVLTVLYF